MPTKNINLLRQKRRRLDKQLHDLMVSELPIGCKVQYEQGDYTITVTVVEHSPRSDRLLVLGPSGAEYWLDMSRLSAKL